MREPAYRLYNCERCQVQVRICERCDHGNVYCAGECARIRRRESQRRSQARYQRGAAAVRGGTPPGNAGGESGNGKSQK